MSLSGHQPAFNERLIQEVQKHPSLYNQTKRSFTDTMERMRIWDKIATAIDPKVTGEFAKKRWLQLRDRYRKELKAAIRHNFTIPQKWCYFSHLTWLDPYLKDTLSVARECREFDVPSPFSTHHFGAFIKGDYEQVKQELDDGFDETYDDELMNGSVLSVLQRILTTTNREPSQSRSTTADLDHQDTSTTSSTVSVHKELQRDEEEAESFIGHSSTSKESEKTTEEQPKLFQQQTSSLQGNESSSDIIPQLLKTNLDLLGWVNDEEMLFARIIGVRLKKLSEQQRKRVKLEILGVLECVDDDCDTEPPLKKRHEDIEAKRDKLDGVLQQLYVNNK